MLESTLLPDLAPATPDRDAVERVMRGDPAAFEPIMRRHNQRLFRIARAILRSDSEAEDVVQETYVRAYGGLGAFRGPDTLGAWLARIAANEALGRIRKNRRLTSLDRLLDEGGGGDAILTRLTSSAPDPERLAASREIRQLLEEAIDRLPDGFRTVFVLRAVEGMSVAETASCLGLRPETVKTRLHRARAILRRYLADRLETASGGVFAFAEARCDRIVAAVLRRLASRSHP